MTIEDTINTLSISSTEKTNLLNILEEELNSEYNRGYNDGCSDSDPDGYFQNL